jgi:hypothetical protein
VGAGVRIVARTAHDGDSSPTIPAVKDPKVKENDSRWEERTRAEGVIGAAARSNEPHASPPLYTQAHVSEAVEWLERIQDEGSHVERSPTFRMWYADPIHRRAFDRSRELWSLLGQRHGASGDSVHPDTRSNTVSTKPSHARWCPLRSRA